MLSMFAVSFDLLSLLVDRDSTDIDRLRYHIN